jgi:hypothetical protein
LVAFLDGEPLAAGQPVVAVDRPGDLLVVLALRGWKLSRGESQCSR